MNERVIEILELIASNCSNNPREDAYEALTLMRAALAQRTEPQQQVEPVGMPFRKSLERLLDEAEHPKGMSVHDGKAHVPVNWIRYLLKRIDSAAPPAVQVEPVAVRLLKWARKALINEPELEAAIDAYLAKKG